MSTQSQLPGLGRVGGWLGRAALAPVRLRTYRHLLYLALQFPLGLGYFVGVSVLLPLGVGLVPLFGVGLLVLLGTVALVRGLAWFERKQLTVLLDRPLTEPEILPGGVTGDAGPEGTDGQGDQAPRGSEGSEPAGSLSGADAEHGDDDGLLATVKPIFFQWVVPLEFLFLVSKFAWGLVAFVLLLSAGTTTMSFFAALLYYDAPGAVVGVVPERSIRLVGGVTIPWGDVAIGAHTVVTLTGWSIDTLPEAVAFAGVGVLFGIVAMNLLVGVSRLSAAWAGVLLDAETPGRIAAGIRGLANL